MFANHGDALWQHLFNSKRTGNLIAIVFSLLCAVSSVQAQNTFNSGSTGADGAFAPATTQTIVVPDSGVFNYTTVNIPTGVTITYNRGTNNKPLTILASGDVVIAGTINLDGKLAPSNRTGGIGGPGGFNGGTAGYGFDQSFSGVSGDGPGGGGGGTGSAAVSLAGAGAGGGYGSAGTVGGGTGPGPAGPKWGAVTILPLIGGSGGGGGGTNNNNRGGGGGGGGGAILIASSGTITINGTVLARGGDGLGANGPGGGGSGGAIRLIANTINGTGSLNVNGGGPGCASVCAGTGGRGYIRLEAYDYNSFTGSSTPTNIISLAFPHPITPPNSPTLRIASVGGVNSPSAPLGSLQGVPDIVVPSSQANPVNVALEGANLPVGTVVQVILTPATGARTTVSSTPLAGSDSASTASASVTLPGGMSVVSALGVIDLTIASAKPLFIEGERVNRIEVAATFGGPSELTYVTQSGRRIKRLAN
jgi:hypothetical protein